MNKTKLIWGIALAVIALTFAMIGVHWNQLPAEVPMHFNLAGEADRYGTKSELFILPAMGLGLWLLFKWITKNGVKLNPNKWGAKTPNQLEYSRDLMAEMTLFTVLLLGLGVYEIMYLAVHKEVILSSYMIAFTLIGFLFVFVRYVIRVSRSS